MNLVNHPTHYQGKDIEAIDVIESFDLGFNLGNAIKYILRAGKKGGKEEDLRKAIWYLQREITKMDKLERAKAAYKLISREIADIQETYDIICPLPEFIEVEGDRFDKRELWIFPPESI